MCIYMLFSVHVLLHVILGRESFPVWFPLYANFKMQELANSNSELLVEYLQLILSLCAFVLEPDMS